MKLGKISTNAAIALVKFAVVFNPEYVKVMDFVGEDPLENFEEVENRGWRLTTESFLIQFESGGSSEIVHTSLFDRKTEWLYGEKTLPIQDLPISTRDFSNEIAVALLLKGLSFEEASKIAKNIFN